MPAELPPDQAIRLAYRWTKPGIWQSHWTARCTWCKRLFDVPPDFYESLESTVALLDHYKAHVDRNRPQERPE
jgi:hypothetical protein